MARKRDEEKGAGSRSHRPAKDAQGARGRFERSAAALRENLRKRKDQARARAGQPVREEEDGGQDGGKNDA